MPVTGPGEMPVTQPVQSTVNQKSGVSVTEEAHQLFVTGSSEIPVIQPSRLATQLAFYQVCNQYQLTQRPDDNPFASLKTQATGKMPVKQTRGHSSVQLLFPQCSCVEMT